MSGANNGPIVLIEDDTDDAFTMQEALKDLKIGHELVYFPNTVLAQKYLEETPEQPFLIICDINMPFQNGLDFKQDIDAHPELKKKCIPFIFYSTSAAQEDVDKAFLQMTIQGFFKKANSYAEILSDITAIIEYWKKSKHPNCW
jgi:response regulator RpfG family c-di-GMP phosphodiesterase